MKKLTRISAFFCALLCLFSCMVGANAANVADATIDISRTGSFEVYKYDITNAEKDGVWDSSYVSTGVKDTAGVNDVLGNNNRVSDLGNGEVSYGYSIKGVEFTYLRVADIRTYTDSENGQSHVEVLYGIPVNTTTDQMLNAIGVTHENRYAPADQTVGGALTYYYQSDTLIKGLEAALASNSTTVKNALENYVTSNGGTAMPETDSYGKTSASGLPLGLYLVVETRVPEMVTSTTAPFLVSLPMTSVDGTNANDGGDRWIYDVTLYPKNLTGIPTLEKTLREAKDDTGKHNGTLTEINDGYAHTATASGYDTINYQIISTLPSITSDVSFLTKLDFVDRLSKGISYNRDDVVIEFFTDKDCKNLISTWRQTDSVARFAVSYSAGEDGGSVMNISMTAEGLKEINSNRFVYTGASMVNSGYSDCTMRITYNATLNSDATVVNGDDGNTNKVTLIWQRTSDTKPYFDELDDDCHLFSFGIDLTKEFSDGNGNYKNVEFLMHNDTDGYFVVAQLHDDGFYYVSGHTESEAEATHFVPTDDGRIFVRCLEDDEYTITEVKTDNGYTLLRDDIKVVISAAEGELCSIYDEDTLGVVQNDERYTHIQKHLEHHLLTASATVDGNTVDMNPDGNSEHAFAPFKVVNTRGFDLPRTGSAGNWMYPVVGVLVMLVSAAIIFFVVRRKKHI